jgi:hypothetical protein
MLCSPWLVLDISGFFLLFSNLLLMGWLVVGVLLLLYCGLEEILEYAMAYDVLFVLWIHRVPSSPSGL